MLFGEIPFALFELCELLFVLVEVFDGRLEIEFEDRVIGVLALQLPVGVGRLAIRMIQELGRADE
jgi:hypothetical protein